MASTDPYCGIGILLQPSLRSCVLSQCLYDDYHEEPPLVIDISFNRSR